MTLDKKNITNKTYIHNTHMTLDKKHHKQNIYTQYTYEKKLVIMLDTVHYHSPVLPALHLRHNHARKMISNPSKGDSPLQDTKKVQGSFQ